MDAHDFVLWVKGVIDTHPGGIDSKVTLVIKNTLEDVDSTWVSKPQISHGGPTGCRSMSDVAFDSADNGSDRQTVLPGFENNDSVPPMPKVIPPKPPKPPKNRIIREDMFRTNNN